jgi:ABC-2 type transport system permease protein
MRRGALLKGTVVGLGGAAFWLGILGASYYGFCFINRYLHLAEPELLVETLLSTFFLLLGAMLLFSNAIIAYGTLFRSAETEFLLGCPVAAETVVGYRLLEAVTFSSWAFLALGFPLLVGYGLSVGVELPAAVLAPGAEELPGVGPSLVRHLEVSAQTPWYYPAVVLAYFVPFVIVPATLGGMAALALAAWVPDQVKRVLGWSVAAGIALAVALVVWLHGAVESGSLFSLAWMRGMLGRMNFARSLFLPSTWVTRGLLACARGELAETGYWLAVLGSTAAMGVAATWELGRRLLRRAWSRSRSHTSQRRRASGRWALARWAPPVRLLIGKDVRVFLRDPVQWSQCAILFGLMGFYVLNLRSFAYHSEQPLWRNLTALLNLTATSLVLATVTTRFIFPLLSLEGRRFWLLGLAPVGRGTLLWSKFALSFVAALAVTVPLIGLSDFMLKLPWTTAAHHVAATVCICFGVSGLSVGLGAVYPDWREENPAKIVSGFGGTLNLLLSIAFVIGVVALTVAPYALVLRRLGEGPLAPGGEVAWWLAGAVGMSLCAGLLPMHLGLRALRRLEF